MTTIETLTPDICREALRRFWDDQTDVVGTSRGVAMALPLMYPDGWQVQVFLEPVSATRAKITDRGQTLKRLREAGVGFEAGQTRALLDERKEAFELQHNGFELFRELRVPIEGVDVQLFAESLVSISHLIYRYEPYTSPESPADRTLQQVFQERQCQPRRNVELDGELEKRVRVDYYIEARQPVACQVVRRRAPLLPYMEQWGFRWHDLRRRHSKLLRAMVYDPDRQEWDETSLKIGREVCDLFCPYYETAAIHTLLEKAGTGGLGMTLKVDREADALYLRLDDSRIIESQEVSPGVVLDFNERNQVVGVEILNLSQRAPSLNCRELQFQTA